MTKLCDLEPITRWGPLELADYSGLDIVLAVMEQMQKDLGDKYKPCPLCDRWVQAGLLGKKTKRGFYKYP